ncbi:CHAT domain-containing tetratricopeptide repeat protein [Algivirga pacifica]|uniref:CHAT domain-containing protein n=1 Tax=Algivirga pacifica TaxID=1162670 RepID=A0ABP9DNB2_9BACT
MNPYLKYTFFFFFLSTNFLLAQNDSYNKEETQKIITVLEQKAKGDNWINATEQYIDDLINENDFQQAHKQLLTLFHNLGDKTLNWKIKVVLLERLAFLATQLDDLKNTEIYLLEALRTYKLHQDQGLYLGKLLNTLSQAYYHKADYTKAEQLLLESKVLLEQLNYKHTPQYSSVLNNLLSVYILTGNEAEVKAYKQYFEELTPNKDSLTLGQLHLIQGRINIAILEEDYHTALLQLLEIKSLIMDENDLDNVITYYEKLSELYTITNDIQKAESTLLELLKIIEQQKGTTHIDYAMALSKIGYFYDSIQQFENAKKYYINSKALLLNSVGKYHVHYISTINNLALVHESLEEVDEATKIYQELIELRLDQYETQFATSTEEEQKKYQSKDWMFFSNYDYMVANDFWPPSKQTVAHRYDIQLRYKALKFSHQKGILDKIHDSDDKPIQLTYQQLVEQKKNLSDLFLADQDIASTLGKINELEKQLAFQINPEKVIHKTVKANQISEVLEEHEVAVEIVRMQYKEYDGSDLVGYAFFMLSSKSPYPRLFILRNGIALEQVQQKYAKDIHTARGLGIESAQEATSTQSSSLYNLLWKPVYKKIKQLNRKVTTVYIANDGIYHAINLSTLKNPKTKNYVLDELNLRYVNSTKDILSMKQASPTPSNHDIVLIGNPDYLNNRINTKSVTAFTPLEGTEKEVKTIQDLVQSHPNYNPILKLKDSATERFVKSLKSPRVLHLATHGFYTPTHQEEIKYSLMNTGLALADAAYFKQWKTTSSTKENGILTAYEAMNIDLKHTELVVLSACETGLGTSDNNEGVYGLPRAFFQAGAKNVLMSLWKVDDIATQKLMTYFYKSLLSGKAIPLSLKTAQQQLRQEYSSPYYWGAFILMER